MRISDWSSDVCSSDLGDDDQKEAGTFYDSRGQQHRHSTGERARCTSKRDESEPEDDQAPVAETADRGAGRNTSDDTDQGEHAHHPASRAKRHSKIGAQRGQRSEEHPSELQSLMSPSYADFCLK